MLEADDGEESRVTALVAGEKVKGGMVAVVHAGVLPEEKSHQCSGHPELLMGLFHC